MVRRVLGKSNLSVSPIGFGAFKIGRNQGIKYAHGYDLPELKAVQVLLDGALDLGINYVDTAPAYGLSEERLGNALQHRIRDLVISTKVGESFADGRSTYDFSEAGIEASIERSLRLLQRDALDLVFIHAPADDLAVQRDTDAIATLQALKTAGKVRAIGLSGKTAAGFQLAFDWADVLMIEYSPLDTSLAATIAAAAARNIGIVIKKGLASGGLTAAHAVPFALNTPGVGAMVIGSLRLEHLAEAVQLAGATST